MDLWIRSQDREMLCKANCVDLMHDTEGYAKVFLNGQFPELIVGVYENSRAVEVVDEIQKLITPQIVSLLNNIKDGKNYNLGELTNVYAYSIGMPNPELEIKELSTVVYEMPKD